MRRTRGFRLVAAAAFALGLAASCGPTPSDSIRTATSAGLPVADRVQALQALDHAEFAEPSERRTALDALLRVGGDEHDAVPVRLRALLAARVVFQRGDGADAGDYAQSMAAIAARDGERTEVRLLAAQLLAAAGTLRGRAAEDLLRVARSRAADPDVRRQAVRVLLAQAEDTMAAADGALEVAEDSAESPDFRIGTIADLEKCPDKVWDVVTRRLRELASASTGAVADAARSSLREMEARAH